MDKKTLLDLIENVEITDREQLRNINRNVAGYMGVLQRPITNYTKSRDAIKSIRNKSHKIKIQSIGNEFYASIYDVDSNVEYLSPILPLEELAELHVIIQATPERKSSNLKFASCL